VGCDRNHDLFEVDCDIYKKLVRDFGLQGFITVKLIEYGELGRFIV
jgi:hypothetical protein